MSQAMYGMANAPNGTGYEFFTPRPTALRPKRGTSQVFSLKIRPTARKWSIRLRDRNVLCALHRKTPKRILQRA
ncbi:hypothetical protein KCP74_16215 [Salmonella enterica subsp. enterica]|nr:hypothetical protein KCP74_16215 [Salmonella enterica subsp. enterica]